MDQVDQERLKGKTMAELDDDVKTSFIRLGSIQNQENDHKKTKNIDLQDSFNDFKKSRYLLFPNGSTDRTFVCDVGFQLFPPTNLEEIRENYSNKNKQRDIVIDIFDGT